MRWKAYAVSKNFYSDLDLDKSWWAYTRGLVLRTLLFHLDSSSSLGSGQKSEGESHFGIMELTWRAGTPLQQVNEETSCKSKTSNFPNLSGKPVELKEPFMLHNHTGRKHSRPKIPKSQSVPPLSHHKVKPFAEKRLNLFRAVNSLNRQDSLAALGEYIKNRNIIKKKFLDKKGNLLPGSFTDHPPPPNTATPISFQASPALHSLNNDSMTSVRSGDSSGRCSRFYDPSRDMTRDTLLSELNRFQLPPISKVGGQNRSPLWALIQAQVRIIFCPHQINSWCSEKLNSLLLRCCKT